MIAFRELPAWAADRLTTEITVHLDWRDRLRLLVQGELTVRADVTVEHAPGRCETASCLRLPHWCWPWHRRQHMALGYVEPPAPRGAPE